MGAGDFRGDFPVDWLPDGWKQAIAGQLDKSNMCELWQFLAQETAQNHIIYPPMDDVFAAFKAIEFHQVKCVILGQDPYHGDGQAHGFSFSVPNGVKIPPSLRNIYKEIAAEFDTPMRQSGDLTPWANDGVLLLNSCLTVRANQPASHQNKGWEGLTDRVIEALSLKRKNLVFMLWGNAAKAKAKLIDADKHLILTAPHPSPFSAHKGFFGCNHFKKANEYLCKTNQNPIEWVIKD